MWTTSRGQLLLAVALFAPFVASLTQATPALAADQGDGTNPLREAAIPAAAAGALSAPPVDLTHGPAGLLPQMASPRPDNRASLPLAAPGNEQPASPPGPVSQALSSKESTPSPPANVGEDEKPKISKQWVEEQVQAVRNSQQLDETTRGEVLKRYQAALDWLTTSEEAIKKTAQYQAEIAGVSESVAKAKAQLATPVSQPL